ncbi:MAG: SHOCT domain-containing protein [Candidatus Scalindua sp.]|nr:SHOCT domain-containing protein [Candidatus Scalindua sp.]
MKIQKYVCVKVVVLFMTIFLLAGCMFNKPVKKSNIVGATIQEQGISVELREELDENDTVIKKNFNHPYYFTNEGLNKILSSVFFRQRGLLSGKGRKRLFRMEELQKIVPPIMNAFAMATDSQDILVLSSSHKILLTDNQSYFSMFIKNEELNIVFGSIHSKKSYNDSKAFAGRNTNKLEDPLDAKGSSFWSLIPMGGQRLHKGHKNWLIIDLSNDMFGVTGDTEIETGEKSPMRNISSTGSKLVTDERLVEEKKKYQGVREKLRGLKDLKDEGLISEEDYEVKKKELLGEF